MSEFDVIVLGGGLAGHCAMLAAAEAGASVLLVEKCSEVGGSTVLSGGLIAFADTPMQRRMNIEDSDEKLLEDLRVVGGTDTQDDLLKTYVYEQQDLYHWLTSKGLYFTDVEIGAGQSAARCHAIDPGLLIATLNEAASTSNKIEIRTRTTAVCLNRASESGPIVGVTLDEAGRLSEVSARGGVIIATGGFSRSEDFLGKFAPHQAKALRVGGPGNFGDGLRMAWRHGADFKDMGQIKGTFGAHATESNNGQELLLMFYRGAIIVNRAGERFVDESISYKLIGEAALAQKEAVSWQVFDDNMFRKSIGSARLFDPLPALNRGLIIKADSLSGLASACGMDAQAFEQTISRYNASATRGLDPEFGRDGLCHHVGALESIDTAPFYAYPSTVAVLATYCGLTIDAESKVIDVYEDPIEGLFAAGEVTGGFHGQSYISGTSLGKAAIFGRRAGQQAAERARRQP